MQKACQIRVFGRVQGVGFRYFTQIKARETGVKGFARNMPDGSVYIEAEGDEGSLEMFALMCRRGPGWANVTRFEMHQQPLTGFSDFEIR